MAQPLSHSKVDCRYFLLRRIAANPTTPEPRSQDCSGDGDGVEADIVKVSGSYITGCLFKYKVEAISRTVPNGTKDAAVEAKRVRMPSIII